MGRRIPALSKRQQLPTVLPNQSPSPQPVHSSAELSLTHRLATAERRRSTPRRFHGRPVVGLSPHDTTLPSSPVYELVTPPSLRLTPISLTRQSTLNALVAEGATNRRTLTAALSKCCSTETATLWQITPTALEFYHQPGQRASAFSCKEKQT